MSERLGVTPEQVQVGTSEKWVKIYIFCIIIIAIIHVHVHCIFIVHIVYCLISIFPFS